MTEVNKSKLLLLEDKAIARVTHNPPPSHSGETVYEYWTDNLSAAEEGFDLGVICTAMGEYKLVYVQEIVPITQRRYMEQDLSWIVALVSTAPYMERREKTRRKNLIIHQLDAIAKNFERRHTLEVLLKDVPEAQSLLTELNDLT